MNEMAHAHQIIWKSSSEKSQFMLQIMSIYFRITKALNKAIYIFLHEAGMSYKWFMSSLVQEQGFITDTVQFWSTEV